jgi:hypothetical protein
VCKRTDSPTMDCPDVCLGMSVPGPYWSDVYVCSELAVFGCGVLTFGVQ